MLETETHDTPEEAVEEAIDALLSMHTYGEAEDCNYWVEFEHEGERYNLEIDLWNGNVALFRDADEGMEKVVNHGFRG